MATTTVNRVPKNTSHHVNERIERQAEQNVARYVNANAGQIDKRLHELDREWDVERTLEANAATAVLVGVSLGALVDRRFFALPAIVAGFLLQHALQGWCPPIPVFRRLGFRTQPEIEQERYALKALRGDFERQSSGKRQTSRAQAEQALAAVRR